MAPHRTDDSSQAARDYIDSILAINREFGMGSTSTPEVYNEAVHAATVAVEALRRPDSQAAQ